MAFQRMTLKLLIDKKGQRVLFAEVTKEFVDFLFQIFSLPLGTLIELLGSDQTVGCLGNLKDSIENFHENYLQPGIKTDDVFYPKTPFNGDKFLLTYDPSSSSEDDTTDEEKRVYRCPKARALCNNCHKIEPCRSIATLHSNSICPRCNNYMNVAMELVKPKEVRKRKEEGFVKEVVAYMVTDDLVVKPMSALYSITLINKFGVKDLSQLKEKVVYFGKDEGLKLLKASLKADKELTTLFMH
ncbi:hypothetical protein R6Q59_029618 [Mikania micrantha]